MIHRRKILASSMASAALTGLALSPLAHAQPKPQAVMELTDVFEPLPKPVPMSIDESKGDRAEVRQFFAYWCPHCNNLEPAFLRWEKKAPKHIKLSRIPVAFGEPQKPLATLFYVLETFPNAAELHMGVFNAIHSTRVLSPSTSIKGLVDFTVNVLRLPREKVEAAWASFAVQTKLRQAVTALQTYDLDSIPAFIVNGRYKTSPSKVASSPAGQGLRGEPLYDIMFKLIEEGANAL